MQWLNFVIIIQVTNKVLLASSPKETFLDANIFLISTSPKRLGAL